MPEIDVYDIWNDVRSYAQGMNKPQGALHLFYSSSVPSVDTPAKWSRAISSYYPSNHPNFKRIRAFIAEDSREIHINSQHLIGGSEKEMIAAIIAFLHPYAFFYESTDYGRKIAEERRRIKAKDLHTSDEFESLVERSSYLDGVSKLVELLTIEHLSSANGDKYNFHPLRSIIMKDFTNKGLEIARELYEKAKRTGREWKVDRITKASLMVAGNSDDFDLAYSRLANMDIDYILVEGEVAMPSSPPREGERLYREMEEIYGAVRKNNQIRYIKAAFGRILELFAFLGTRQDLFENVDKFYNNIQEEYDDDKPCDSIDKTDKADLQRLLSEIKGWADEHFGSDTIDPRDGW